MLARPHGVLWPEGRMIPAPNSLPGSSDEVKPPLAVGNASYAQLSEHLAVSSPGDPSCETSRPDHFARSGDRVAVKHADRLLG
jgi:hypothetical protein